MGLCLFAIAVWIAAELADAKKPWNIQREVAEREAMGKPPPVRTYREIWVWYGAAVGAAIAAFLGLTARWWMTGRKIVLGNRPLLGEGISINAKRFTIALSVITLIALAPRLCRMNHSLWGDEEWSIYSHVWGSFSEQADGSLQFERHPWVTTIFYNDRANNHLLLSVLAKLCLEGWNNLMGHERPHFTEWTTRVPSLVAGMIGILAIAWWLRDLGHPLAGLIAAGITAIHPNHLRYCAEARGYALAMTLITLAMWMACRALRHGSHWGYWVLFALFELLALLAFSASIYVLAVFNLVIVVILVIQHRRNVDSGALHALKRWFVANSLAASIYLPLALPLLVQTARYIETSATFSWNMGFNHYLMLWARAVSGFDYVKVLQANPIEITADSVAGGRFLLVGLTVLLLCAAVRAVRGHPKYGILIVAPLLAIPLALAHSFFEEHAVFPQYFLPSFGAAAAAVALYLEGTGARLSFAFQKQTLPLILIPATVVVATCLAVHRDGLLKIVLEPTENLRGAADVTRWRHEAPYADEPKVIVVSSWRSWELYDPRIRFDIQTPGDLQRVIDEAVQDEKELYVVIGHLALAEEKNAGMLKMLRDPLRFEAMDTIWGRELLCTLWPYRLIKPHSSQE